MSNHSRCAACKFLRRRCSEDCIFAPYFPSTNPQKFACVHKIYGASNVSKMLQETPVHLRGQAADSMFSEAEMRIEEPVYGSVGIITRLQHEIYAAQCELARTRARIAFYRAQEAQQTQLHHHHVGAPTPSSSFSVHEIQDPMFQLDGPLTDLYQSPEFDGRSRP